MPALEEAWLRELVPDVVELAHEFMFVGGDFLVVLPLGEGGRLEHFEYEHGVVGGKRASAFGDDVGLFEPVFLAHVNERVYGVVGIFLYGVVHR